MRSEKAKHALATINHNIALARRFVGGMSQADFEADERTVYAVTRCRNHLGGISATARDMKARHQDVPWALVAGAGNVYRHDYDGILPRILWHTVQEQLAGLDRALRIELERSAAR